MLALGQQWAGHVSSFGRAATVLIAAGALVLARGATASAHERAARRATEQADPSGGVRVGKEARPSQMIRGVRRACEAMIEVGFFPTYIVAANLHEGC
jgi:hypothetical protein